MNAGRRSNPDPYEGLFVRALELVYTETEPDRGFGWIAIGEEWQDVEREDVPVDRQPFRDFSDAIKNAKLAAEPRHLRTSERASATDWKAAALDPGADPA